MIFIFLSILCSVSVGILLKLARRYRINIAQAVTFNYFTAIVLGLFFFKPEWSQLSSSISVIHLGLGILLPLVFWILAMSIQKMGIVKTDIAQRLSLFIPLLAAWLLFGEHFQGTRLVGLITGLLAILLILMRTENKIAASKAFIYPVFVFAGFGLVDILFKKIASNTSIPYTTSLVAIFCISFALSLLGITYLIFFKREKFQMVNVLCGGILGLFNFGNILFYLKAHKALADTPSIVFSTMNMGVIILGSLVGVFIFKEKLNKLNYLGLILAIVAIVLISKSK